VQVDPARKLALDAFSRSVARGLAR